MIFLLAVVLLVVIAVSAAALFFLPGKAPGIPETPSDSPVPAPPGGSGGDSFNLQVLQRSDYQALNAGLLQSGLLPVQPPAITGKANPFL